MMQKKARFTAATHIRKVSPPKYWKDRKTKQTEVKMFCVRNDCYQIDREKQVIIMGKNLKVQYASDWLRREATRSMGG